MNTPPYNREHLKLDIYVHTGERMTIISSKSGKSQIKGYNPPLYIFNMYIHKYVLCRYWYVHIYLYMIGESLKIASRKSGKTQIQGFNPPLEIANMLLSSRLKEFYMKEIINQKKSTKMKEIFNVNQVCLYL
jgi:hypothetical protein